MAETLRGDEYFHVAGTPIQCSVSDFWRWAYSNLNHNVIRGVFAEFIVGCAMGMDANVPRHPWASVDLRVPGMPTVEVKCSAYLQEWEQQRHTIIAFGYPATRDWDETTGAIAAEKTRKADVYVFCLFTPQNRDDIDTLNFALWEFYVVPTKVLNERTRSQTSITLASLKSIAMVTKFAELKAAIVAAAP